MIGYHFGRGRAQVNPLLTTDTRHIPLRPDCLRALSGNYGILIYRCDRYPRRAYALDWPG